MALIVDNNPNPEAVEFNYTNCERVFWNSNLVWPDYDAMYFWIQPLADGVVKSKALGFLYNGSTHFQQSTKPISYSINGGDWVDTTVDALNVNVGAGQKIYLKSEYVAHSTPFAGILRGNTATANEYASGFSCNVNYRVGGSTNSLIKGNNETIKGIFGGQTKLTDASKLSIGSNIYSFM